MREKTKTLIMCFLYGCVIGFFLTFAALSIWSVAK